jgi:hypothetical protein
MARSPSHRFGQIIGNLLESIVQPLLSEFCADRSLYLDYQGRKRSFRKGKKVSWKDDYGNQHDLDYVIERNGTDASLGQPVGFVEVAWRRYTKHSRNKAQEIQGAVLPLAEKYRWNNPFLGVVLAGEFTDGSIEQLRSLGFQILHFPYEAIVDIFAKEGVDIRFDESTPDEEFRQRVKTLEGAPQLLWHQVRTRLLESNREGIQEFLHKLDERLGRNVERITIIPLYGRDIVFYTLKSALDFPELHSIYEQSAIFRKYELLVKFSNGDRVEATFATKEKTKEFLQFVASQ